MTPPMVTVIPLVPGMVFLLVKDFGKAVGFGFGISKIFGMYLCLGWNSPFSSMFHPLLVVSLNIHVSGFFHPKTSEVGEENQVNCGVDEEDFLPFDLKCTTLYGHPSITLIQN